MNRMDEHFAGIIFDFNGVLLWDSDLHEEAFKRFAARIRRTPLSREEMELEFHGRTNRDIIEYLLGELPDDARIHELAEEKEGYYRQLARALGDGYHLAPGAIDLLNYLVANGIPRAIATSSPKSNVDFFIERLDLLHWFDEANIVYDAGRYPGKPAPFIYLEAADRLALAPARCIVVEDAIMGIKAAHDATIGAVIAISSTASAATLVDLPGVRQVIPDLTRFPRELLAAANLSRTEA